MSMINKEIGDFKTYAFCDNDFKMVSKEDILSIGDNLNDIDMFRVSGIGAAINNASEEVKKFANYITLNSAENGGFAEAIYKFIPF